MLVGVAGWKHDAIWVVETTCAPCNQPVYCVVTKQRRHCRRQNVWQSVLSGVRILKISSVRDSVNDTTPRPCLVSFGQILRHQIRRKIKRQPNTLRSFYFSIACMYAVREKNSQYAAKQLIKSRRQNITGVGDVMFAFDSETENAGDSTAIVPAR